MSRPYDRADAKRRAGIARAAAEYWRADVLRERERYVESAKTEEDRIATRGCVEIARRHAAFELAMAALYDRIAVGEEVGP